MVRRRHIFFENWYFPMSEEGFSFFEIQIPLENSTPRKPTPHYLGEVKAIGGGGVKAMKFSKSQICIPVCLVGNTVNCKVLVTG